MTVGVITAVAAGRWLDLVDRVAGRTAPPDPLGPSDRDVDEVRDVACEVTASSSVCSPPDLPDPEPRPPAVADGGGSGAGAFGQLLVILLVAALVVALGWLVWQFVRGRPAGDDDDVESDLDEEEPLDDLDAPRIVDEERPPDRWRRAAAEWRERGDFREAIRCEYRALVGDLARAGHVDEIPGRTSGEERGQVAAIAAAGSGVSRRFDEAAEHFDRAWFDDAAVTADDDRRFLAAADAVLGELRLDAGAGRR